MIEKIFVNISKNENEFNTIKGIFQTAINKANYNYKLKFNRAQESTSKNRKRKCIYYNPPFCLFVKTKIGARFIELIDKHLNYRKIFNRKNLKLCCVPNIKSIISGHNKKLLNVNNDPRPTCNCRLTCHVEDKCQYKTVNYSTTVTHSSNNIKEYF